MAAGVTKRLWEIGDIVDMLRIVPVLVEIGAAGAIG